jgi:hypothetical protein
MKRPHGTTFSVKIVAALLACYIISIGPAARLADNELISIEAFALIYAPILWPARRCPPAKECVIQYCEFWTGKAYSFPMHATLSE